MLKFCFVSLRIQSAVTGEIQHVDCGYHTVGMVAVDERKAAQNY